MKSFKKLFRKMDLYALPVTLRYKGEKKFYTNFGALTSLFIILLMLAYIGSEINVMLSQTKYTTQSTVFPVSVRDLASGDQEYSVIVENGVYVDMTFGLRAFHPNGSDFNDSSYFTFDFHQTRSQYSSFLDEWSEEEVNLPTASCKTHPLFYIDPVTGLSPSGLT